MPLLFLLARPAPAQIKVTPASLDFGERGHYEKSVEVLLLENKGKEPVTIGEVKASCGCIELDPPRFRKPIPPGGSEKLTVSMSSGRAMGRLDKYVAISVAGGKSPQAVVPVRMRVFEDYTLSPLELHFDGVVGGQPLTQKVEIQSHPRAKAAHPLSLEVVSIREQSRSGKIDEHFEAKVVDSQGSKRIEVTLKPTHPEGLIWAELEAKLDGKPLSIPISGNMFRSIKVVPTYFNFSKVSVDAPSSFVKESTFTSTDGKAFKILSVTPQFQRTPGPDVKLVVEEAGESGKSALEHVLRARISGGPNASGEGDFSGKVVVKTDHPEKPELVLTFFGFFPRPEK